MRHVLVGTAAAAAVLVVVAGCSSPTAKVAGPATGSPTPSGSGMTPSTSTPAPIPTGPHFATADAAMTYLAQAYDSDDQVDLGHVTNPSARAALTAMRSEAVDLRLVSCTPNPGRGDDTCVFDHDFPAGYTPPSPDPEGPPPDGSKAGWAQFTVAPAEAPGWYMTVLESCD